MEKLERLLIHLLLFMNRVLFILHLPPPIHGSSVVGQQIHDSKIIYKDLNARFVNLNTSDSTAQIGKLRIKKLLTYARIIFETIWVLLSHRPNLACIAITVKGGGFYKDCSLVFLMKLFRVRILYHLHNKGVSSCQDRWPYRWLYPWFFRNSRVILLSKYLYSDIRRFVPEEAVEICPNGIPDGATNFMRGFRSHKPPIILFLSNLIESKGVFILLEACALLKKHGVSFRAKYIGGEADVTAEDFTDRCRSLGLTNEVAYLGRKYGREKASAFSVADVFAFPTFYHNETFGLVNLEAMQYRLPVVATPEGGIPDVVVDGETGYLVPQRNAEALANALEKLIRDPDLRRQMGEAGRNRYQKHFTAEAFEKRMQAIVWKALSNANSKNFSF